MKKKYHSLGVSDTRCPRCHEPAEAREHKDVLLKQLAQPFYFSRWFNCKNEKCATTIFMRDEFKVVNKNGAAKNFQIAKSTIEQYDAFKDELAEKLRGLI